MSCLLPLKNPTPKRAGRVGGVLRPIVERAGLARFHAWEKPALSGSLALQLIGDEPPWDLCYSFEQFTEKLLRGPLISTPWDQDLQPVPVLISSPLQVVMLALNREPYFLELPFLARARTPARQLIGIRLA